LILSADKNDVRFLWAVDRQDAPLAYETLSGVPPALSLIQKKGPEPQSNPQINQVLSMIGKEK
jgi:hypothetical protein